MTQNGKKFGIIFDIDGTMVNNTPYHRQAWFDLCERYGIALDHQSYHEKIHARSNDKIVPNLFGPRRFMSVSNPEACCSHVHQPRRSSPGHLHQHRRGG